MKALLIVDVQNDFCPGGTLAVKEGNKVIPVINRLMDRFPLVIASKDWHPAESIHFQKWPVHCVKETEGAGFHSELHHDKINEVFLKGTKDKDDGYSAFEASNVDLNQYLVEKGVDELYITGLATDYCVKASALDAAAHGFKTFVVEDAVQGVELHPGDIKKAMNEMKEANITFISSNDIN